MRHNKGIGIKLYTLILFMVVFMLGIGSFTWMEVKNLNEKSEEKVRVMKEYNQLMDDTRQAQVSFKIQVQEWKNILIRGYNKESFDEYYKKFCEQQESIQSQIKAIREHMVKQKMDTALVDDLLNNHKQLYENYNEAIKSYKSSNTLSYREIDKLVKGIDRKPTEQMDELVVQIQELSKAEVQKIVEQSKQEMKAFYTKLLYIIIGSILLVGVLTVLIISTYRGITKFIG